MERNLEGRPSSPASWRKALLASPGPRSAKESGLLALKGFCMGSADIIPGVSGGTIALITGIYQDLLRAISSVNMRMLSSILKLDFKAALAEVHVRFLLPLFLGIGLAIMTLARVMNYLLHHHPVPTWSLFFGLILASILVVGRQVSGWVRGAGVAFGGGLMIAYLVVGLIPISTPEAYWFIFLSGFVAVCAMILPGLSGAFILLILGKYEFITATLKNPFLPANLLVIAVFCAGCVVGLLSFSRVLNFFLRRFPDMALAFLTGLMAGSLKKIWPWKEVLAQKVIGEKVYILESRNVLPSSLDIDLVISLLLMAAGFALVLLLEKLASGRQLLQAH